MKFDIGNVKEYSGSDLVLLVGCPGSRWSSTYVNLVKSPEINISDWNADRLWPTPTIHVSGELRYGKHLGTYWGPNHEHGHHFDKLFTMSKAEILEEFMQPFANWDKIKIIKSHWFAYHIDYLHALFPKAIVVSTYANDIDSFYWWHKCGGWGIPYPSYSWYENDTRMLEKIKEENYRVLKFNRDRNTPFELLTSEQLYEKLGLEAPETDGHVLLKSEVAVYDGSYMPNFGHIVR